MVQTIQDDLQKQGNAFQKSVADFENKVNKGLLTRSQAEQQQAALQERQQQLQNLNQEKAIEVQEKEAVMLMLLTLRSQDVMLSSDFTRVQSHGIRL